MQTDKNVNNEVSMNPVVTKLSETSNLIGSCYYCLYIIFSANPVRHSKELRGGPMNPSL